MKIFTEFTLKIKKKLLPLLISDSDQAIGWYERKSKIVWKIEHLSTSAQVCITNKSFRFVRKV